MKEPLPDGFTKAATIRNWSNDVMGTIGFKRGVPRHRWRFLNGNTYYLPQAVASIGADVIVDTDPTFEWIGKRELLQRRGYESRLVVVVPHTHNREKQLRGYLRGLGPENATNNGPAGAAWDPTAPPDPIHFSCPVPVEADFGITGLIQAGTWQDPSHLEAARRLLLARYDLKIGLWDLANNETLRQTLLDEVDLKEVPTGRVAVPPGAATRAARRVAEKISNTQAEASAQHAIARLLVALEGSGWIWARQGTFRLGLTEPVTPYEGAGGTFPLVSLNLTISKRSTTVDVFNWLYNDIDIGSYLAVHRAALEQIAAPDECPLIADPARSTIWKARGGWADEVDWHERSAVLITKAEEWVNELRPFCEACRQIFKKKMAASQPGESFLKRYGVDYVRPRNEEQR
jgi:hypothetical protein